MMKHLVEYFGAVTSLCDSIVSGLCAINAISICYKYFSTFPKKYSR